MSSKEIHTVDRSQRPVFRKGQELTAERLNALQDHQIQGLRQALLGVAGSGVIHGFKLGMDDGCLCHPESGKLYVSCGVAIDGCGRQLRWPGGWLGMDDFPQKPEKPGKYTLNVHFAEQHIDAGHVCGCFEDDAEWIEEGVVFTLSEGCEDLDPVCAHNPRGPKDAACASAHVDEKGQDDALDHRDAGNQTPCLTERAYIANRLGSLDGHVPPDDDLKKLCEGPGGLCYKSCGDWLYDHDVSLPLACLVVEDAPSGPSTRSPCEAPLVFADTAPAIATVRPHVYRNALLHELIHRCHLDHARVVDLSFRAWIAQGFETPVAWIDFVQAIKEGLSVGFSKHIRTDTLHNASVFVAAAVRDKDTYFQDCWRLPVEKIEKVDVIKHRDGRHYARGVKLTFNQGWIHNQLESELSRFHFGATIEFTVRGALLRDICDNMLDGRPLGFPNDLPGQAMPGGDFIAPFCVDHRPQGGEPKGER